MAAPAAAPVSTTTELAFASWNEEKPTTIVLLHGGFTCRLEFDLVIPHLSDFHVLVPDLPLHSASRHVKPGTINNSAFLVAQLIQSHAHGGKAHVVGVSMGGYVGQCLALELPDIVLSLFVTGAAPLAGKRLFKARWPRLTYLTMLFMLKVKPISEYRARSLKQGVVLSEQLLMEMRDNVTWDVVRDMFPWILEFELDHVFALQVRVLLIAGAKGDNVPIMERTAEALMSRRTIYNEAWPEDGSGAVLIRDATHGWDMQFPELFAQGVSAWVLGEDLPKEFERLYL
ncbi:alpha/beta hydrolase fold-1 [Cordyceps militaris CM01]|uniref:Alpha/beta hydrolase fold-1 n=1 Tax=Cordyceps militaris (strain CM01) TaxID=983644 RepID=G3JCB8_CORMM|nr:alpha/beta hydrolase fold-1 [Cordyceps militaris CM01]EGX93783.1 alpha/beta hydrolase fold-1 [Cordyceps militaris CM01]